jgi:hypothetical protein
MTKIMKSRKISLHRTILIYLVLVGIISVFSVGYLWISSERSRFDAETRTLRASYFNEQQKTLKLEVDRALAFVRYMQSQTEKRLKDLGNLVRKLLDDGESGKFNQR